MDCRHRDDHIESEQDTPSPAYEAMIEAAWNLHSKCSPCPKCGHVRRMAGSTMYLCKHYKQFLDQGLEQRGIQLGDQCPVTIEVEEWP